MKLINKFTLWYLCIAMTCTVVGTVITFYSIKSKMDNAAVDRLKIINGIAAEKMNSGLAWDSSVLGRRVEVQLFNGPLPAQKQTISKSESSYPGSQKKEYRISVSSILPVKNKNYRITSFGYVIQSEHLLAGIEWTILWKWLLILFLIAVSASLVSRIILSPFKKTLRAIELFNIRNKERIQLPDTNTQEFQELNRFVRMMTDKAVDEYISLKEFTENASHELQTPVAVVKMKLELLAESAITNEQAALIAETQESLEKLSRINSSLVLLTRLENHEYATHEPLRFCQLINRTLDSYKELMEMKSITLTKNVASKVYVQLNPMLGQLLLDNLISNAIRHNKGEGTIHVQLTHEAFIISNTGSDPSVPTSELFKRFKKGNQSGNSIGIGLAIVKQICDIHLFEIDYTYERGVHRQTIRFREIGADASVAEPAGPVAVEAPKPSFSI
jgi:two-component system, OmpR family, sensor histidine kinase QseC